MKNVPLETMYALIALSTSALLVIALLVYVLYFVPKERKAMKKH